ncbi:MAG: glycosyltransferase [Pyrinomonadaceae bacterium]|nr:glycosyltransferase [Pyrinomonadaceae bacterium]
MKIVRVIARLNVGGPARHVVWLTAGLQGVDCDSLLVAGTVPPGEEDMSYFAAAHQVEPLFISEMSREISFKDALTIWKIYRRFCRESPDVVHTHTAKAGTVGRVAGFLYRWLTPSTLLGRPRQCLFVHTYHGHIFHSYYGPLKTRLFLTIEKVLARLITDRIVVVSEQQRREIQERFGVGRPDQFAVIPLGLDTQCFADWRNRRQIFRDELGVQSDEMLVGIVGRLTGIKNHELFLRAVAILKDRLANEKFRARPEYPSGQPAWGGGVRFVVIGDGSLRDSLEALAQTLGLVADVIFAGSRRDPENFYPALDIVALTSLNEGTPLTLIEAMANARPVIATEVGGVVDLLGDAVSENQNESYSVRRRGVSVPSDDVEAFAAAVIRLVEDSELRRELGERGLAYVTCSHSQERLLNDVMALYNELLKRRPLSTGARPSQRSLETESSATKPVKII